MIDLNVSLALFSEKLVCGGQTTESLQHRQQKLSEAVKSSTKCGEASLPIAEGVMQDCAILQACQVLDPAAFQAGHCLQLSIVR